MRVTVPQSVGYGMSGCLMGTGDVLDALSSRKIRNKMSFVCQNAEKIEKNRAKIA